MVGIIEEQHPNRARLFMQWKEMDWPVLVDSLNRLGVKVVPITVLVDAHGIVRARNPDDETFRDFLTRTWPEPENVPQRPQGLEPSAAREPPGRNADARSWTSHGDALFLWHDDLDGAIAAYRKALERDPDDGALRFRLGVALRRRSESSDARRNDFADAVAAWQAALDQDPNQYIWRRRIQQYGPRLDKPYPFYDWIRTARKEIRSRGDTPPPLRTEPTGAEFAAPVDSLRSTTKAASEPDPEGRIHRDPGELVRADTVVVPSSIDPGDTARIHVRFRPEDEAHWNNQVDDLVLWADEPTGWTVQGQRSTVANPPTTLSRETRSVELEVEVPDDASGETLRLPAYALYYVCEEVDGTCLYRRQDVPIEIDIRSK